MTHFAMSAPRVGLVIHDHPSYFLETLRLVGAYDRFERWYMTYGEPEFADYYDLSDPEGIEEREDDLHSDIGELELKMASDSPGRLCDAERIWFEEAYGGILYVGVKYAGREIVLANGGTSAKYNLPRAGHVLSMGDADWPPAKQAALLKCPIVVSIGSLWAYWPITGNCRGTAHTAIYEDFLKIINEEDSSDWRNLWEVACKNELACDFIKKP
jgi:hypothetical protein